MTARASATRLSSVPIPGPAGELEAIAQEPAFDDAHPAPPVPVAALICHPHPLYGGTMHNKVVHRVASALHEMGAAVLRFNFRGVGRSAGHYDQGRGEFEDARAALAWFAERHPGARLWAGGFSFGSGIAARLAAADPRIGQLVLIAPPVVKWNFEVLNITAVPKLVIQGTADDVCPLADLEREFPRWAEPKRLVTLEGAGHFFDRQLGPLADAVRAGLGPALRGN